MRRASPPIVRSLKLLLNLIAALFRLLADFRSWARPRTGRPARRWRLQVSRKSAQVKLSDADRDALLRRHRDLKDFGVLADFATRFQAAESDFHVDPAAVERLLARLLEERPPWLFVGRVPSEQGEAEGADVLWRTHDVREIQLVTLFTPEAAWRDLPLASLTMRPARGLHEMRQARLIDQVLPPEVLLDRCARGEVLIPIRHRVRRRLEFDTIERSMELTVRKALPVSIAKQAGSSAQVLYFLLDSSASMQGSGAVAAAAAMAAAVRANLGTAGTRYLFRRYADDMWPPVVEEPVSASTVDEKDRLLTTMLATNFNGSATHVNDALRVAIQDVETLRKTDSLEASILLITDGRAEIAESTALRLAAARIHLHTVMVSPDKNPGLSAVSESFTILGLEGTGNARGAGASPQDDVS